MMESGGGGGGASPNLCLLTVCRVTFDVLIIPPSVSNSVIRTCVLQICGLAVSHYCA